MDWAEPWMLLPPLFAAGVWADRKMERLYASKVDDISKANLIQIHGPEATKTVPTIIGTHRWPDGRHMNTTNWGRGCRTCALEDELYRVWADWAYNTGPGRAWLNQQLKREGRLP